MILGSSEREMIVRYIAGVEKYLGQTPENTAAHEAEMLVLITKMMMSLPGQKTGDDGAEATAEAYCVALDDIPVWAVTAAIRRWYRGDVTISPKGPPPNFDFRPSPARLRSIAYMETSGCRIQVIQLRSILNAETRIEYTDEHRKKMLEKLQTAVPRVIGDAP